jgi:hypothetical protein
MKSDLSHPAALKEHRFAVLGLLALAATVPAFAGTDGKETYTWSAELVEVDEPGRTVTVQSRLVGDADVDFDGFDEGDRLTLSWSGINIAAGVRRIVAGRAPSEDTLTLPMEFVSAEHDRQYVRFKVPVPSDDLSKIASLQPGSWVTATSPRRAAHFEEAVDDLRPYNDVG